MGRGGPSVPHRRVADARGRQSRDGSRAPRPLFEGSRIADSAARPRTRVKICGCTSLGDVEGAIDAGADAVGFIVAPSPNRIALTEVASLIASVPPYVSAVAVFVNPGPQEVVDARALGCIPQFSGDEEPAFCRAASGGRFVKALHVRPGITAGALGAAAQRFPAADLLVDSRVGALYGGTGTTYDWSLVQGLVRERRVIVGGGLTAENVAACVRSVRPFAVDVRSGVETNGRKDRQKMRAFVRAIRESDAET